MFHLIFFEVQLESFEIHIYRIYLQETIRRFSFKQETFQIKLRQIHKISKRNIFELTNKSVGSALCFQFKGVNRKNRSYPTENIKQTLSNVF